MFTNQAGQLDKLTEAGMDPRQVEILRSILGNCQQKLEHRGPVVFDNTRPDGATDAGVTINEYSNRIQFNQDPGASSPTALGAAKQNMLGAAALQVNGLVKFDDHVIFKHLWAVAGANWANVAGDDSYVDCYLAKSRDASQVQREKPDGTLTDANIPIRIYLPRCGSGQDPNVQSGNLVGYALGPDGAAMATTPYLDGTIGKSLEIWEGNSGDLSTEMPGWTIQTDFNSHYLCGAVNDADKGEASAVGIAVTEVDDHSTSVPDGEYTITTTPTGGSVFTTPAAFKRYIIKRTS